MRFYLKWNHEKRIKEHSVDFPICCGDVADVVEQYKYGDCNSTKVCDLMRGRRKICFGDGNMHLHFITDYYGQHPVYMYQHAKEIIIFTHFQDLYNIIENIDLTLDKTGIWETFLFDGCIGTRTIYKEVKSLPSGYVFSIDKRTGKLDYKMYFNYEARDVVCTSVDNAVSNYIDLLRESIKKIPYSSIILPLSAGYDSRMLAILLSESRSPEVIRPITYACHRNSYEVKYASIICKIVGFRDNDYFHLKQRHYLDSLELMRERTGGNLSVAHSHLFNLVQSIKNDERDSSVLVSGVYGEIAGTFASGLINGGGIKFNESKVVKRLKSFKQILGRELYDEILEDLRLNYDKWKTGSGFKTFDEYKYFNQRVPKALFILNALCEESLPLVLPYTDPDIVEYFLGLPYNMYLPNRELTRLAINKLRPEMSSLPVLSYSRNSVGIRNRIDNVRAKIYNNIAKYATIATMDRHLIFSPYQTECQDHNLRGHHRIAAIEAIDMLLKYDILDKNQHNILTARPIRQYGGWFLPCSQYWAITIVDGVQNVKADTVKE